MAGGAVTGFVVVRMLVNGLSGCCCRHRAIVHEAAMHAGRLAGEGEGGCKCCDSRDEPDRQSWAHTANLLEGGRIASRISLESPLRAWDHEV